MDQDKNECTAYLKTTTSIKGIHRKNYSETQPSLLVRSQQNSFSIPGSPVSECSNISNNPEVGEIQKVLLTLYDLYKDGAMTSDEHRMFKSKSIYK